jgi:hypothetical protein
MPGLSDPQLVVFPESNGYTRGLRWLESIRLSKGGQVDTKRSPSVGNHLRFDERLFEARLWSLRRRSRMLAEKPHGLMYTVFLLRLSWVVVVVPFLTGAACAFVLSR